MNSNWTKLFIVIDLQNYSHVNLLDSVGPLWYRKKAMFNLSSNSCFLLVRWAFFVSTSAILFNLCCLNTIYYFFSCIKRVMWPLFVTLELSGSCCLLNSNFLFFIGLICFYPLGEPAPSVSLLADHVRAQMLPRSRRCSEDNDGLWNGSHNHQQ